MKNFDDFVNQVCKNQDYKKLLIEVTKEQEDDNIKKTLEKISNSTQLNKEQKDELYKSIFDYVKDINQSLENKIKDIYLKGFKEASVVSVMLTKFSSDKNGKIDQDLELCINDYVLKRLNSANQLQNNEYYNKLVKDIQDKNQAIEGDEELEEMKLERKDIENIDSYSVGFKDAIRIIYEKN